MLDDEKTYVKLDKDPTQSYKKVGVHPHST